MMTRCFISSVLWLCASGAMSGGEVRAPQGVIVVAEVAGEAAMIARETRTRLMPDARIPVGAKIVTAEEASVKLVLSNGTAVFLGGGSELSVQEFFQAPFDGTLVAGNAVAEPSVSQVKLLLLRGELAGRAPKLAFDRGSRFSISTGAGELMARTLTPERDIADEGIPLTPQALAAFQARGLRVGARDGSTVFRVACLPVSKWQWVLALGNGGGDFVFRTIDYREVHVPEGREVGVLVDRTPPPVALP